MAVVKWFDEFNGVWNDVSGTSGQTLRFDANGNVDTSNPIWGDISGNINTQLDLKNKFDGYVEKNTWQDYSSTSTIVGFSAYTTKKVQYIYLGSIMIVQYLIFGTSNATNFTFTIPTAGSSYSDQYFNGHAVNNTTTQNSCTCRVQASSTTVEVFLGTNITTPNAWTASGTKRAEGVLILAI